MNKEQLAAIVQESSRSANESRNNEKLAKLHAFLKGQATDEDIQRLAKLKDMGLSEPGGSVKVGEISTGGDPMARHAAQGPIQAGKFLKAAQGAYKPINDQLDAAQATIESLNQGNAASDKLALINEARIAAGMGGSRAIAHLVDLLSGGQTAAGSFQDKLNWLQNTPNIPTMQPAQRDAIREAVFNRLPQMEQSHQQAASSLLQQGPILAPQADHASLINSFTVPAQSKLERLKKMQSDYSASRSQMQPQNAVSSPAAANENPTSLDRLKSFFTPKSTVQAPQIPQPQGTPPGAMGSPPQAKKVSKKQYSKSLNKTRIVYDDGSMDTVDGLQQ